MPKMQDGGQEMQQNSLTDLVLLYQSTGRGREFLLREISLKVYYYPKYKYGWSYDECSDFFCFFYPRIATMIENFTYQGKPFEAYLTVTMRFQLKTFIYKRVKKRMYNRLVVQDSFLELSEKNAAYSPEIVSEQPADLRLQPEAVTLLEASSEGKLTRLTQKRRLLFLALLGSMDITLRLIEAIAYTTGYEMVWLFGCIQELRERMHSRKERLHQLTLRRNRSIMRVYRMHEQLSTTSCTMVKTALTEALIKEKDRIDDTIKEMGRVPLTPTHRDIAEVLHIPKGTVDSALFHIKHAFEHLYSDSIQ